jgi:hypothetical protein
LAYLNDCNGLPDAKEPALSPNYPSPFAIFKPPESAFTGCFAISISKEPPAFKVSTDSEAALLSIYKFESTGYG